MVAEAKLVCQPAVALQYLSPPKMDPEFLDDLPPPPTASPIYPSRLDSGLSCSTSTQIAAIPKTAKKSLPRISSGSHTDIGPRSTNEDQHIQIDDLCSHLGSLCSWGEPAAFYAIFDGHGGPGAAAFMKNNAMRFFFEDAELLQASDIDKKFLRDMESSLSRSFLLADRALADEHSSVDSYCGTTALTALIHGRNLLVANAGDCRAVLCRRGIAVQLSRDHRATCPVERKRVENLGGTIERGYLNGELAVTRALGDWYMKLPFGSASPLIAEPEFQWSVLGDDDEFLIIGCDGIWDVISNQEAINLVRRELRVHDDPQQCAEELVKQALRQHTCDNVTAIVISFSSSSSSLDSRRDSESCRRPKTRFCISEEARSKLRGLLEGANY